MKKLCKPCYKKVKSFLENEKILKIFQQDTQGFFYKFNTDLK